MLGPARLLGRHKSAKEHAPLSHSSHRPAQLARGDAIETPIVHWKVLHEKHSIELFHILLNDYWLLTSAPQPKPAHQVCVAHGLVKVAEAKRAGGCALSPGDVNHGHARIDRAIPIMHQAFCIPASVVRGFKRHTRTRALRHPCASRGTCAGRAPASQRAAALSATALWHAADGVSCTCGAQGRKRCHQTSTLVGAGDCGTRAGHWQHTPETRADKGISTFTQDASRACVK